MEDRYLAYMLRLWRVGSGEGALWRASLESPRTGEHRGFASLEALIAFLEVEMGICTCTRPPGLPGDEGQGLERSQT